MSDVYRIGENRLPKEKSYSDFDTLKFNNARSFFIQTIDSVTTPLTIGLYGPWGSGKTTMITGIVEQLQKNDCLTLVFDAWKYRHEKNLILPLLCALQREHLPSPGVKDSAQKIVTSVAFATLAGYLKHNTGIGIEDFITPFKKYEDGYEYYKKYDNQVSKIEDEYQKFIANLLKKTGKKKVVIFIDNLDRCLPDIVVNLLEDISSFLSIREVPCVYVLTLDKENAIKAIKHRFPDFDGADYLEKIVQIPLKMPTPQNSSTEEDAGRYHFMKRYEFGKKYEKLSSTGDVRDQIFKELANVNDIFNGDLFGNPRRIERVVNKLILLESSRIFDAEKKPADVSILIFSILLAEYFPVVYESLRDNFDFKYLRDQINASVQGSTSPYHRRQEREHRSLNSSVPNEIIFDAYCDNEKFFLFLKGFSQLAKIGDLEDRLKEAKNYLNYIG